MNATASPKASDVGPEGGPVGGVRSLVPVAGHRLLAANLAAIFATDLTLARKLDVLEDADLPALVPTRSGVPTAAVTDPDGKPLYLHSRHDPRDEARRLVATIAIEGKVCFAVQGVGLGYHVAELLERTGTDTFVLAFESDLRVLRRALECVDLTRAIMIKRLAFVTEPERGQLFAAIGARTVLLSMGTASVSHGPSQRLRPEFHAACSAMLSDFAAFSRTSLNTLVLNGRKTAENVTRNVAWYAAAGGLARLHRRYAGRPAIIVSAGPSLRKNKHLLREAKGRAVIIAVQTTFRPLLAMGVEPDFVTSLDHHVISGRFFEGLPKSLRTELVADTKAARVVLDAHPGPVSVVGNEYADGLLREMKLDRPLLPAGATVAHLAYYLARHLGCDPVLFVGQDLGFSDGLCYSPGTSYDEVWRPELGRFCSMEMKQWDQIVRERPILRRIPAAAGGTMYTEERLFTYLQQFERDFAQATERVFDCTEGGALKQGARPMPLAEALERFCTSPLPVLPDSDVEAAKPDFSRSADVARSLRNRREEAGRIERVTRETLPLLEEIRDHHADQSRVNRAIARLDQLRARMNDLGATYDLITHLTQQSELERFESDLKISNEKDLDPHARQLRQVQRDITNCRAIMSAAVEFQQMMDGVLAELDAGPIAHSPTAKGVA